LIFVNRFHTGSGVWEGGNEEGKLSTFPNWGLGRREGGREEGKLSSFPNLGLGRRK